MAQEVCEARESLLGHPIASTAAAAAASALVNKRTKTTVIKDQLIVQIEREPRRCRRPDIRRIFVYIRYYFIAGKSRRPAELLMRGENALRADDAQRFSTIVV